MQQRKSGAFLMACHMPDKSGLHTKNKCWPTRAGQQLVCVNDTTTRYGKESLLIVCLAIFVTCVWIPTFQPLTAGLRCYPHPYGNIVRQTINKVSFQTMMNNIFHNKLGKKKLARAETSSIYRQMFADMLCRSRTQFEFVSTSWSTFVC